MPPQEETSVSGLLAAFNRFKAKILLALDNKMDIGDVPSPVLFYANYSALPTVGDATALYIVGVNPDRRIYVWNPTTTTYQYANSYSLTAGKLENAQTVTIAGFLSGTFSFNGTAPTTVTTTVTNQVSARTLLGLGTISTRNITVSTAAPSGGADGDLWFQY